MLSLSYWATMVEVQASTMVIIQTTFDVWVGVCSDVCV